MSERVRVVVADDDPLVRAGIRLILTPLPRVEVVAEAPNGREAVELALRHRPHVVLLDIQMPVLDGLGALAELRRLLPETPVIILTTFGEDRYVAEALQGGAAGFLLKDSAAEELGRALEAVLAGEAFLSPAVTRSLLNQFSPTPPPDQSAALARVESLSGRERDILLLVAEGISNAEIAERLWITEATVKTHVSRVLTKLGCENRVQAAILTHQAGLLDRPSEGAAR
jgi:DNA-binding NarL/FixJ family response regulator